MGCFFRSRCLSDHYDGVIIFWRGSRTQDSEWSRNRHKHSTQLTLNKRADCRPACVVLKMSRDDVVRVKVHFDRLRERLQMNGRGVINIPLPRRCITALVGCTGENEVAQKTEKINLIRRIGKAQAKIIVIFLNDSTNPINCELCNSSATDMVAFIDFKHLGVNGDESCVAHFNAFREWIHCDSVQCKEMAEYNSKKGDEVGDVNTNKDGDEAVYYVFKGAADVPSDFFDHVTRTMGPGIANATDLAQGVETVGSGGSRSYSLRIDYTPAIVSITPPQYFSFPPWGKREYKQHTSNCHLSVLTFDSLGIGLLIEPKLLVLLDRKKSLKMLRCSI